MNRIFQFQLVLLFILCCATTNAQVLISKHVDEICFGPKNVKGDTEVISLAYLEHIDETKTVLEGFKEEQEASITALSLKTRLNKRDKRKLENLESIRQSIEAETVYLSELKRQWTIFLQKQNLLKEAFEHQRNGKCLSFTTNDGIKSSKHLELLKLDEGKKTPVKEFIEVSRTEGGAKWERRRADKNCLSANPDDCLVWCLVKIADGYAYTDMSKRKWSTESCPNVMKHDEHNAICYSEIEIEYKTPIARYELVGKTNDKFYQFFGFELEECPN